MEVGDAECAVLPDPVFVGSAFLQESLPAGNPDGDDDKVYFFFSETGKEFDYFENTIVSRIARVCKVGARQWGRGGGNAPRLSLIRGAWGGHGTALCIAVCWFPDALGRSLQETPLWHLQLCSAQPMASVAAVSLLEGTQTYPPPAPHFPSPGNTAVPVPPQN